jgi:lipoate-protein ligase A
MLILSPLSNNPYFNAALEEYLLRTFTDEIFMLYINDPCIVIGKHQNTLNEINYKYVKKLNLPVVRRISGGGTVYHDTGNVNFTFIKNGKQGDLVNFKKFVQPIIEVLGKLGLEAHFRGHNDIRIHDKKISGNAEHVYKQRVLHHGTLLFESELSELNEAIRVKPGLFEDKAVQSVRATVDNISHFLKQKLSIHEFMNMIYEHIMKNNQSDMYTLSSDEMNDINELKNTKYQAWDWIYGYSPFYKFLNHYKQDSSMYSVQLEVKKGTILYADFHENQIKNTALCKDLEGLSHEETAVLNVLKRHYPSPLAQNLTLQLFFT